MGTFDHLAINELDLIEALQNQIDDGFWVLNLETGEVVLGGERYAGEEDDEEIDYDDPDRFEGIQPIQAHEAFQIMEAFVESLPDTEGKRSLDRSLRHSRPFRSFKDTLNDFLSLREVWFKFQHDRMLEIAQEWVEDHVPGAKLTQR